MNNLLAKLQKVRMLAGIVILNQWFVPVGKT